MYYGVKAIVAVLLCLGVAAINSDHIEEDCREIQCPHTEIDCPSDSELKSGDDDNIFDKVPSELIPFELFSGFALETSTQPQHEVHKRSFDHFKYKNYQSHRISKRESGNSHLEAAIKRCCPESQCICKECDGVPKCQAGEMVVLEKEGNALPGSCCSTYKCVPALECSATSEPKVPYYKDECTKCDCYGGLELCQKLCEIKLDESANNCYSEYLSRPMLNGDTWREDQDCTECRCEDGESQCQESICDPVDCPNPVKVAGRCCKVCPPTQMPTTTSTTSPTDEPQSTSSPTVPPTETTSVKLPTTEVPIQKSTPSDRIDDIDVLPERDDNDVNSTFSTPKVISSLGLFEKYGYITYIILATILAVAFVTLLSCMICMHLQKQKKNKSMYSTIPCFESNQSSSEALA